MAKSTAVDNAPARSDSISIPATDGVGNAVLAAWQGLYHLFGARGTFRSTPEGIAVEDFTTLAEYDPSQIASDVSHRNRRLDFAEVMPWFSGMAPEPFVDSKAMTQWSVQFLRGSVEENSSRTPRYVRDAVASYKNSIGIAKRRGPKKKIFRLDNLTEINESTLEGVSAEALESLKATLEKALASANSNTGGSTPSDVNTVAAASAV